jgi:hypothetical protein
VLAQHGDEQRAVAAADVDQVAQRSPVVGGDDVGRPGRDVGAHLGVEGRRTGGVGGQVVPERAAELGGEGGLAGADGVQQLDEGQLGTADRAVEI